MVWMGIIFAIVGFVLGFSHVVTLSGDSAIIAHFINIVMGFCFGVSVVKFFEGLSELIKRTEEFINYFIVATFGLMISGAYLVFRFARIFGN